MKRLTLLFTCFIMSMVLALAQNKQVSGTVVDENGEPVAGASVYAKGATSIGTATNAEGQYSLSVPASVNRLIVKYIGYIEAEVAATTNVQIKLTPDEKTLGEVVVTALGITREKKALGYATQDVKSDKLSMTGNTDLSKSLQGKVVGVDLKTSSGMPGASSQFVIRGARSFDGDNTPLYVIDGMPITSSSYYSTYNTGNGSISGSDMANRAIDIDANDIESVNILRGQAAAALYGMRASNGAVIITTKSGKGKTVGKTNVNISQTTSFDAVSRIPQFQTTWAEGTGGKFNPINSYSWGCKITDLPNDPKYGGNSQGHPGQYQVQQLITGGASPDDAWVTPGVYNNWKDYFRTGIQSTSSILVSRAENTGNFAIGLSYTDQTGIALNTGMQKYNAKVIADRKLNDHFTAGFSANFAKNFINKLSGANDGSLMGVMAAPPSYNLKGLPYHAAGDPYTQVFYRSLTFDNPYWVQYNNTFTENTNRFFGNMFVQYATPLAENQKLTIKYQLGADAYTSHYQDIMGYGHAGSTGYLTNRGVTEVVSNSLLTANYDWNIIKDLDFNLIVGNEINNTNDKTYYEYGQKFNFGGWNHIGNTNTQSVNEQQSQDRTVGAFGNLSLSYLNMLYLTATARQDVVSYMPPNHRKFVYPSVSLGFVFTELNEFKGQSLLNFGKLRASYAEVGAVTSRYMDNFYYRPSYGGGFWQGAPIVYPLNGVSTYLQYPIMFDPNLKPQNTKSSEVGIDLNFFKNSRIGISYTYSNQNTVDQIFQVPLAGSTGASSLVTNGGQMKTTSHELTVNLTPVLTNDFRWDINVNYYKPHNEVVSLREGVESIYLGGFTTPQVRAGIGYTYPVIYGTQFRKDSKGRILVDEDPNSLSYGMPMSGEPGVIGTVSPKFILGGGTTLTYKALSLGAVLEWKSGGQMYSGMNGLMDMYGNGKRTEDRTSTFIYKGYKADGTPNDIVRGGPNDPTAYQTLYSSVLGNIDEAYIYGNSFIKLREISLKYALPKSWLPKMNIAVSAFARNILLWSELPNADPESSQGNDNMMGAFERFSLPQTTSYGFSLNVNF